VQISASLDYKYLVNIQFFCCKAKSDKKKKKSSSQNVHRVEEIAFILLDCTSIDNYNWSLWLWARYSKWQKFYVINNKMKKWKNIFLPDSFSSWIFGLVLSPLLIFCCWMHLFSFSFHSFVYFWFSNIKLMRFKIYI
jgi:hypothetical protein